MAYIPALLNDRASTILPYGREAPAEDWLLGAAAVCMLTFDVDGETPILAEGAHHARDLSTMSHQAYGPRVGVPRIIELLARYELPATFFVPGMTAERWPGTVEAIVEAGHEVGFHTHEHRPPLSLSAEEEREDFERGLAALRRATGAQPRGFRASYWQLTETALQALVDHAFTHDASLMDDDRPYRLRYGGGELAELPVHWLMDDWEQYAYLPDPDIGSLIETPAKAVEVWTSELDAMRRTHGLFVLTAHPFISGRPSRVEGIASFVEWALERGDVRFSRADELAELVLGRRASG